MRLFLDVNVFIDVLTKRADWEKSFDIIRNIIEGKNEGYISALTPAIIYFFRKRILPEEQARKDVIDSIEGFKIVELNEPIINASLKEEKIESFEDAIQFHSAKDKAKILITRNKKHFRAVKDEIELMTPEEFLKKYQF
ncbi:MAG: PIN domain-containing protein [archaeon]|nr:PIN domain-containing protein [archaeon]MCP8316356.1 PIN domain-containing protein [archaeon]